MAVLLALIGGNAATVLRDVNGGVRVVIAVALIVGAACLVASVAGVVVGVNKHREYATTSGDEIANYLTIHFSMCPSFGVFTFDRSGR